MITAIKTFQMGSRTYHEGAPLPSAVAGTALALGLAVDGGGTAEELAAASELENLRRTARGLNIANAGSKGAERLREEIAAATTTAAQADDAAGDGPADDAA